MKFEDYKCANGVALQAFCDLLLEKSKEAGCRAFIVIVKPEETATASPYAISTNVPARFIPDALEGVLREFRLAAEQAKTQEPS